MTKLEVIVGGIRDPYGAGSITGGTYYDLSDKVEYIHTGNDGFGLPTFERFRSSSPVQDGATDLGFLLRSRKIQLDVILLSNTEAGYWALRQEVMGIFAPRSEPIILKFTTPARSYFLDCYANGALTLPSSDRFPGGQRLLISLEATDPLFYSGNLTTVLYDNTKTNPYIQTITYTGTYKSEPIFVLYGPLTSATIELHFTPLASTTAAYKITFNGTLVLSENIVIDTRYNKKTVKNTAGTINFIQYLTTSSDLYFPIETSIERPVKTYKTTVTGQTSFTQIVVRCENKYIGI